MDSGGIAQIPEIWPWWRQGPQVSEINDLSESGQGLGRGRPDPGNLALEALRPSCCPELPRAVQSCPELPLSM